MAESISVDINARDNASAAFRSSGRAAADASVKYDLAAASLKLYDDTIQKQGKAAATSTSAMKAHAAAAKLLTDAENVLAGRATVTTKLMADQGRAVDDAGKKAAGAAAFFSKLAGGAGGGGLGAGATGMGALIGVGVALAPVIATVGTGLLGLGAAAYGIYKPISNAASATGGLSANLGKLDPLERQAAVQLLALGKTFEGFQQSLKPVLLHDFASGIQLAGTLMHDVQPVAQATGVALGGLLDRIDTEFKSQTWQQFFGFMAANAGPDVKMLGDLFVNLTNALPPLLTALQPLATELLKDASGAALLIGDIGTLTVKLEDLGKNTYGAGQSAEHAGGALGFLAGATKRAFGQLVPAIPGLASIQSKLHLLGGDSSTAAKGTDALGKAAATAKAPVFNLAATVAILNTDMTTLVGNLLTLQGDNVAWKQSMQAAETQLRSNTAGLSGNSKNSLANQQAVIAATNAAITFAGQQLTLHHNIDGASRTIQTQINWLEGLRSKSSVVRQEIEALRDEEAQLAAQRVNQRVNVTGTGTWSVHGLAGPLSAHVHGATATAGGWLVSGGTPGRDSVPIMAMPGELVVPSKMVTAGAVDHLRGSIPGFAAGGIVPKYTGAVAGLQPWVKGNDAATIRLIDQAVASATFAGVKAAQQAAFSAVGGTGGPASGAVRALQAYAASLFHFYGWGSNQLPPLISLWNGESGWNPAARNPSSGAFGIPQALPPGKMGALAASGNAAAQIRWGEGYIHSVYGDPANAYGMWLSRSPHWYGGGLHGMVTKPTVIGVGERGAEQVDVTPVGRGRRPSGQLFGDVHIHNGTDSQLVMQRISFAVMAAGLGS